MLLPRENQLTKSGTFRCNHARHACSMKPRRPSCCQVDDGKSTLGKAQFWWTLMLKLKAFTLTSAEALWLKGVREGALPVARRARSNSVRPRASQLRIVQNSLKPMVNKTPIKLVPDYNWDKQCRL